MANNENWENMNAEVSTEEEKDENVVGAVVPDTDDAAEEIDTNSASPEDVGENDADDEKTDDGSESKGLNGWQKGIIISVGIILILLLIWLLAWLTGINRESDRGLDNNTASYSESVDTTQNTDGTSETQTDPRDENDGSDKQDADGSGNGRQTNPSGQGNNNGNSGNNHSEDNGSGGNQGTTGGNGGDSKPSDTGKTDTPTSGDEKGGTDTPSGDNKGGDSGNGGNGGNNGNTGDGGNGNSGENSKPTYADYSGETAVHISSVNENTGIITITVDGGSISVPVQTTVFNGRVTKSGVAQGKLFGYTCGATVMLFYPQEVGFANTEVSGYMSRNDDGLTVLVDINGEGSKLLIKINGMKSLF